MNFINQLLAGANFLKLNFEMQKHRNPILENEQGKTPEKNDQLTSQLLQQSLYQQVMLSQALINKSQQAQVQKSSKKISKRTNECGHPEREHYAKGMCNNCYHKHGRTKKPWICGHDKLYAQGLCQNCYINKYNQKRREQGDQLQDANSSAQQ